jgi:hypothetical protein
MKSRQQNPISHFNRSIDISIVIVTQIAAECKAIAQRTTNEIE